MSIELLMILPLATALLAFTTSGSKLPPSGGVTPVKVAEVPGYSEGAVVDRAGNVYISDVYNGTIYRVAADGTTSAWAKTPAPNGHKILADGSHLVCDGKERAVLHLDADGKILRKASAECEGKPLRAPNDLSLDPEGGFYFTDPGGSSGENPIGTVHFVDAKGTTHLVASGLAFPNGILLTPDRKRLLVCESGNNVILEYPIQSPGRVGAKRVFAKLPSKGDGQIGNSPDGMCFDEDGNIYIAHWGMNAVQVLGPKGELLRTYRGGPLTTSNVAFGGPHMDQLYVTGAIGDETTTPGALFRLDLKGVRGRRVLPQK